MTWLYVISFSHTPLTTNCDDVYKVQYSQPDLAHTKYYDIIIGERERANLVIRLAHCVVNHLTAACMHYARVSIMSVSDKSETESVKGGEELLAKCMS